MDRVDLSSHRCVEPAPLVTVVAQANEPQTSQVTQSLLLQRHGDYLSDVHTSYLMDTVKTLD